MSRRSEFDVLCDEVMDEVVKEMRQEGYDMDSELDGVEAAAQYVLLALAERKMFKDERFNS